jgi:1,4-alpha-glucan branching enzyme
MHSTEFTSGLHGVLTKKIIKPVPFICHAKAAEQVCIMGDFNDWDPTSYPMNRQIDGAWRLEVPLTHGHHQYVFVVDGQPTLDPNAQGTTRNELGEKVSLIGVS